MKLVRGAPLNVALAFDPSQAVAAARLAMQERVAQLEWSLETIRSKLHVAGLFYPPEGGLQAARTRAFDGLHGFLADSLPEGWGYLVMRKRLARLNVDIASLNPLERLALVGASGRGALVFEPATTPDAEAAVVDLDQLADESLRVLRGEDGELADILAKAAGGSGGARPKVHVGFNGAGGGCIGDAELPNGYSSWIVKFRAPEDPADIGPIEEAYALMAEQAGLPMSEHRLLPAKSGPGYFATRRFDRPSTNRRLHMISLAGAVESPSHTPSSYDVFFRATRAITRRVDDVSSVLSRMVFNILAHNRDDHTRQHAYLMDETGDWRLAPVYDLTYSAGPGGEHYLDVEGEGRAPTRKLVAALANRHGLRAKDVDLVIDRTKEAVEAWPRHASAAGVSAASSELVRKAHEKVWSNF